MSSSHPTPASLRAALQAHQPRELPPLPGRRNHVRAGVLVALVWQPHPWVILTERSERLRHHAGEVCFPGGRPEPQDPDLQATALREAREEIGLTDASPLGQLSSVPLYTSDYRLVPFVAQVQPQPLTPSTAEVAAVLHLDLPRTLGRGWLHAIPWTHEGQTGLSPVFELDGRLVYGGTAHVLYELLEVVAPLVGIEPPRLRAGRYEWRDVLGEAAS